MDKADAILAAIGHIAVKVDRIEADVAGLKTDVAGLSKRMDKFEVGQVDIKERLIRVDARLNEQRQTVNALIPTKIAAVGGR